MAVARCDSRLREDEKNMHNRMLLTFITGLHVTEEGARPLTPALGIELTN